MIEIPSYHLRVGSTSQAYYLDFGEPLPPDLLDELPNPYGAPMGVEEAGWPWTSLIGTDPQLIGIIKGAPRAQVHTKRTKVVDNPRARAEAHGGTHRVSESFSRAGFLGETEFARYVRRTIPRELGNLALVEVDTQTFYDVDYDNVCLKPPTVARPLPIVPRVRPVV